MLWLVTNGYVTKSKGAALCRYSRVNSTLLPRKQTWWRNAARLKKYLRTSIFYVPREGGNINAYKSNYYFFINTYTFHFWREGLNHTLQKYYYKNWNLWFVKTYWWHIAWLFLFAIELENYLTYRRTYWNPYIRSYVRSLWKSSSRKVFPFYLFLPPSKILWALLRFGVEE